MERDLVGKRPSFHQERKGTSFYRIMILLGLIVTSVWIMLGLRRGEISSPLDPTPTPTRMSESYFLEARAYFDAGNWMIPATLHPGRVYRQSMTPLRLTRLLYRATQTTPAPGPSWPASRPIRPACCGMMLSDWNGSQKLEHRLIGRWSWLPTTVNFAPFAPSCSTGWLSTLW